MCFLLVFSFLSYSDEKLSIVDGVDILTQAKVHQTVDGKKGLVIVFLSAKCPCSDSHVNELKSLYKDYPAFSFVAVNANVDETLSVAQEYFKRVGFEFPVVKDNNTEIADRYKAFKTPHAFVVNNDAKIVYQGGVSSSRQFATAEHKYLRDALANIQDGKPVAVAESRTLGCVISRGEKNVW